MAAAFRSIASTTYASRTNTTVSAPAGIVNDDILIAAIFCAASGSAPAVTPPSGFTLIGTPTVVADGGGFTARLSIYWKRAASESGSYIFTHASGSSQAFVMAVSGALASGSPIDASSANSLTNPGSGGSTSTATGVTTTGTDDLLLYIGHDWQGSGAISPPTGMTERFDGLLYTASQALTSSGATGNKTQTTANGPSGEPWAAWLVALKSATGASAIAGTASITEAADTVSSAAALAIKGTTSATEASDTVAATGAVAIKADLAATEAPDTVAATATLAIAGSVSASEAGDTVSATSTVAIAATLSVTEAADTVTATAAMVIVGSMTATEAGDTVSATGAGIVVNSASATITEAADTLSAAATITISGSLSGQEAPDTLAAAGTLRIVGSVSGQEAADSISISAALGITATATLVEAGDSVTAAGRSLAPAGTAAARIISVPSEPRSAVIPFRPRFAAVTGVSRIVSA